MSARDAVLPDFVIAAADKKFEDCPTPHPTAREERVNSQAARVVFTNLQKKEDGRKSVQGCFFVCQARDEREREREPYLFIEMRCCNLELEHTHTHAHTHSERFQSDLAD